MLTAFVSYGENNLNQTCANTRCGMTRFKPRATHYHRFQNSWVCSSCAQAINREYISRLRLATDAPCITSEQYLLEKLVGK